MFYDLNVPWAAQDRELQRTIAFLDELGYNVVALNHTLSGKLPGDLTCPIPQTPDFPVPPSMRILRRCTLTLHDPSQNHRISTLSANYDILALRPTDEKTLKQACESADCDIVSIDMTQRLSYYFKFKMLSQAIERGARIEICYGPSILAKDSLARRNVISNVIQLIRATRGRGIIISSGATNALGCRAPWDVINLTTVWGLSQERGKEALSTESRNLVAFAQLKRNSYRGAVNVVYGGERPKPQTTLPLVSKGSKQQQNNKRKVDADSGSTDNPISKREKKRREKQARLEAMPIQPERQEGEADS
ncbi:ribonuclease P/MRP 30kDa subunit [Pseudovirgaria hyperparasitica]|uniref:Ribonuclease P/MRP 30kDa subunit n=1 Tax=Pseudovirgaria hyperparasitica TaxID=470096 RepID=A0A6A6VVQ4_9PEZI|nr:ribonuclease P/MRP 30kDa subunit [Pseudovirgaria hyperparasitica]KAF2754313.1 ribonuclease P/MRP 30kDa subunit [Pseudovirgaria hyperparasitica]